MDHAGMFTFNLGLSWFFRQLLVRFCWFLQGCLFNDPSNCNFLTVDWHVELKCLDSRSDRLAMARSEYQFRIIFRLSLTQQHISQAQKKNVFCEWAKWHGVHGSPMVPQCSPFAVFSFIDWQCSSRLSACWATAAQSVKQGRMQPNVVRPAGSEMCSIDRSITFKNLFQNLHTFDRLVSKNCD